MIRLERAFFVVALLCPCGLVAQSLALMINSAPGTGVLTLSLDPAKPPPAAVQWTLAYPPGSVQTVSVTIGPAAGAAGKSLACASTASSSTCLVSGLGSGPLLPGVLANVDLAASSPGPIWITQTIAVWADGSGGYIPNTGGSPGLQSIACSPSANSPASATCVVRLSGPASTGGIVVAISTNPAYVAAPPDVTVPEGADSVTFDARPAQGRPSNAAAVKATLNGVAASTQVALAASVAQPGLIVAYAFDEGSGGAVYDYSGGENTGDIQGAAWTEEGRNSGAMVLKNEGFVDIGDIGGQSSPMTWSAWVYPTNFPPDDGQIVARSNGAAGWEFKTSADTGKRTFSLAVAPGDGSSAQRNSATTIALNTWYFVAGVYDGASRTLDIYVNGAIDNGILAGEIPTRVAPAPDNATIGRRAGGFYFEGLVDDLRIYSRALSAAEVRADMGTPVAPRPIPAGRLESLSCAPELITVGGMSTCTVSLSGPAAPGSIVTLSSATPLVSVPREIAIPAGAASAVFRATAAAGHASGRLAQVRPQTGTTAITASFGPDTVHADLTVLPLRP